ncbi:unnamed protein product [Cutaneotrichosporon oleaginosum]
MLHVSPPTSTPTPPFFLLFSTDLPSEDPFSLLNALDLAIPTNPILSDDGSPLPSPQSPDLRDSNSDFDHPAGTPLLLSH